MIEMERRSWPENSGSVSSHPERCSDDQDLFPAEQDVLRTPPISTSPSHVQSPEVSSNTVISEAPETIKSLGEKLSAALTNIKAKEDLVKQHAKVAEEAVSGWEKAETEVASLKQQLDAGAHKNSALVDRISHLDGALKECVRQLRQSREDQELKIHEALIKKTRELDSEKSEFEGLLIELRAQLDAKEAPAVTSSDHGFRSKLETLEKENSTLKVERELSIRAAEIASKQHLESIKKVAKLEAECRRLRALARKSAAANDHKLLANSVCVESLTDSQSDMDIEPSCSDSWASALIAELDQFKNEKVPTRNLDASSMEVDLMDDFLEMERLAALPEPDRGSSSFELDADLSRTELESVHQQIAELEANIERMTCERGEMDMAMAESQDLLKLSSSQLLETEDKLVELQRKLDSANGLNRVLEMEVGKLQEKLGLLEGELEEKREHRKALESQLSSAHLEVEELCKKVGLLEVGLNEEKEFSADVAAKAAVIKARERELESKLESARLEVEQLHEKMGLLEKEVMEERELSAEYGARCRNLEELLRKEQEGELQHPLSSNGEVKTRQEEELNVPGGKLEECRNTIASLGRQLKSLATFEDFMLEAEEPELINRLRCSHPMENRASSSSNSSLSPTRTVNHIENN